MKKILTLLLSLSITISTLVVASPITNAGPNENIYGLLVALGIVDDTFGFKYDQGVSRMEFASVAVAAGAYDTSSQQVRGVFADVSSDNEYARDIEYLYDIGVVRGDENSNFEPSRLITLDEAMIILLRVAGYTDIVEARGGYLNGYRQIATKEGLLEDVAAGDVLSGDGMLVMVYNMLNMNAIKLFAYEESVIDENETILSKRHHVYYRNGVVKANSITSLYGVSEITDGVMVETKSEKLELRSGTTDIESMLGNRVTVYYRYDEASNESTCVYYELDKRNTNVSFALEKLQSITPSTLEYDVNGSRNKKLKLDHALIVWNGAYYVGDAPTMDMLEEYTGSVTVIDNDGDGNFDVLLFEVYSTYVVSYAVSDEEYFYDLISEKNGNPSVRINVKEEEADVYEFVFADGGKATFEDLVGGMVVSVGLSSPACEIRVVKVILSNLKKSGTITGTYTDSDGFFHVTLDGVENYLVPNPSKVSLPKVGSGVTLYIDAFGKVAYAEAKHLGDYEYGFVTRPGYDDDTEKASITLYTQNEKFETLTLSDRVVIDAIAYRDKAKDAFDVLKGFKCQIGNDGTTMQDGILPIRYKTDANNIVTVIDTEMPDADGNENALTPCTDANGDAFPAKYSYSSDGVIGAQIPLNGQTTVLNISTVDKSLDLFTDPGNLSFMGISSLKTNSRITFKAYKVDKDSPYADFVLYFKSSGDGGRGDYLCVVDNYDSLYYDEETEETLRVLKGMVAGKEVKLPIAASFYEEFESYGIHQGDVIEYLLNNSGQICELYEHNYSGSSYAVTPGTSYKVVHVELEDNNKIKMIEYHNIDEGKDKRSSLITDRGARMALLGDVKSRYEGLISYYYQEPFNRIFGNWAEDDMRVIRTYFSPTSDNKKTPFVASVSGGVTITVVDFSKQKNKRIYAGTYDDIRAMDNDFEHHSRVLIRYYNCYVQEMIIFND